MESGPFRAPRSTETEVTPQEEQPKTVYRPATPRREAPQPEPKKRRFLLPAIIAAAVIILAVIGWALFASKQDNLTPIDSSKYQAVWSTSGLVYFGKLQSINSEYFKLSKAYYLQQQSTGATATQDISTDQKLIKLSDAIHGPEDEMIIPKAQVLFYQNLKSDSKVAQAIAKDNP